MEQNFDIIIGQPLNGRFPALAVYAPLGTASDQLTLDPRAQPLADLLAWAARSVSPASANLNLAEELGEALYAALLGGRLGDHLRSALQHAEAQGGSLRIRLATDDLTVLSLPWEFLYDRPRGLLFATDEATPLVRYLSDYATFGATRSLAASLPLRLLMVVPAVPDLDMAAEIARVREALDREGLLGGLVEMTALGGPQEAVSLQRLSDLLQDDPQGFDILHFSGHGDTEGGRGNLRFNDDRGGEQWVDGGTLGRLLKRYTQPQHRPRPLRLAVLNACEGGVSAPQAYGVRSLLGVAPALIQNGLAAVVAMQYEILDAAAIAFARAFYRALTRDTTSGQVDAAVTAARRALATQFPGHRSFATPVLFVHTADGRIFDLAARPAPVARAVEAAPAPVTDLAPEQEALLRSYRYRTPANIEEEVSSQRRQLAQARFHRDYLRQQIQEQGSLAPPGLAAALRRAEEDIVRLEESLEQLEQAQEAVDVAQIPPQMTISDYLTPRLSNEALQIFMAPLPEEFDTLDVVQSMRRLAPGFARRVAAKFASDPDASDARIAAAVASRVGQFVAQPGNGYRRAPNGRFRRVRF